jgi:hypothetical protein
LSPLCPPTKPDENENEEAVIHSHKTRRVPTPDYALKYSTCSCLWYGKEFDPPIDSDVVACDTLGIFSGSMPDLFYDRKRMMKEKIAYSTARYTLSILKMNIDYRICNTLHQWSHQPLFDNKVRGYILSMSARKRFSSSERARLKEVFSFSD